jgi:hypothetical protein
MKRSKKGPGHSGVYRVEVDVHVHVDTTGKRKHKNNNNARQWQPHTLELITLDIARPNGIGFDENDTYTVRNDQY